jgi:hypothetical protein
MPNILPRKKYGALSPAKIKKFLDDLEKTGNFKASCAAIGVVPATIYTAMRRDKKFAEAVTVARDKVAYDIELELRRRAIEGVEEQIYHQGEPIGVRMKYYDRLLELLAKGNIEKYGKLENNFGIEINVNQESMKNKLAGMLGITVNKKDDVIEGDFTLMQEDEVPVRD